MNPSPSADNTVNLREALLIIEMREKLTARMLDKHFKGNSHHSSLRTSKAETEERIRIIESGTDSERQELALGLASLLPDYNVTSDPGHSKTIRVLLHASAQHMWHKKPTSPQQPKIKIFLRPGGNNPGLS